MTARIYGGYHRRYNFWCINHHKNPKNYDTLLEYKKFLSIKKNLSPRYIKGVISFITKKWFPKTPNEKYKIQRSNRMLSLTEMQILLDDSLSKYETDETALLILLVSLIPNIRPKYILERINTPHERRCMQLHDIYDDKDRIENVNHFIQEELKFQLGLILPKKMNTYCIQLKNRATFLLGKEKGELINFETLQRTSCYFKKLFKNLNKKSNSKHLLLE